MPQNPPRGIFQDPSSLMPIEEEMVEEDPYSGFTSFLASLAPTAGAIGGGILAGPPGVLGGTALGTGAEVGLRQMFPDILGNPQTFSSWGDNPSAPGTQAMNILSDEAMFAGAGAVAGRAARSLKKPTEAAKRLLYGKMFTPKQKESFDFLKKKGIDPEIGVQQGKGRPGISTKLLGALFSDQVEESIEKSARQVPSALEEAFSVPGQTKVTREETGDQLKLALRDSLKDATEASHQLHRDAWSKTPPAPKYIQRKDGGHRVWEPKVPIAFTDNDVYKLNELYERIRVFKKNAFSMSTEDKMDSVSKVEAQIKELLPPRELAPTTVPTGLTKAIDAETKHITDIAAVRKHYNIPEVHTGDIIKYAVDGRIGEDLYSIFERKLPELRKLQHLYSLAKDSINQNKGLFLDQDLGVTRLNLSEDATLLDLYNHVAKEAQVIENLKKPFNKNSLIPQTKVVSKPTIRRDPSIKGGLSAKSPRMKQKTYTKRTLQPDASNIMQTIRSAPMTPEVFKQVAETVGFPVNENILKNVGRDSTSKYITSGTQPERFSRFLEKVYPEGKPPLEDVHKVAEEIYEIGSPSIAKESAMLEGSQVTTKNAFGNFLTPDSVRNLFEGRITNLTQIFANKHVHDGLYINKLTSDGLSDIQEGAIGRRGVPYLTEMVKILDDIFYREAPRELQKDLFAANEFSKDFFRDFPKSTQNAVEELSFGGKRLPPGEEVLSRFGTGTAAHRATVKAIGKKDLPLARQVIFDDIISSSQTSNQIDINKVKDVISNPKKLAPSVQLVYSPEEIANIQHVLSFLEDAPFVFDDAFRSSFHHTALRVGLYSTGSVALAAFGTAAGGVIGGVAAPFAIGIPVRQFLKKIITDPEKVKVMRGLLTKENKPPKIKKEFSKLLKGASMRGTRMFFIDEQGVPEEAGVLDGQGGIVHSEIVEPRPQADPNDF